MAAGGDWNQHVNEVAVCPIGMRNFKILYCGIIVGYKLKF
jgi:hypothetical protein